MRDVLSETTKAGSALGSPRFWQWPTILALDAPLVAMAWQLLFARIAQAELSRGHCLLLGASVWLAYTADRWIDGWSLQLSQVRTQRHFFFLRWRWPLFAVWAVVVALSVALALVTLEAGEWKASFLMLAGTLGYLGLNQALHRCRASFVPKEVFVAAVMTAGTVLYPALASTLSMRPLALAPLLFFVLCLANCLLIAKWERGVDLVQGHLSFALQFSKAGAVTNSLLAAAGLLGAFLALGASGSLRLAGFCGLASAAFLFAVDYVEPVVGREAARLWVDIALLSPFAFLPFL